MKMPEFEVRLYAPEVSGPFLCTRLETEALAVALARRWQRLRPRSRVTIAPTWQPRPELARTV